MNLFSKLSLSGVLFSVLVGCAFASENLKTHNFFKGIQYVYDAGIVSGYSDGTYRPDNAVNRAEFTKIIVNTVFETSEIESCVVSDDIFSDIMGNEWFAPYICIAKSEGIIGGYPDGSFRPAQNISLVEAAKIIDIAFGGEEISATPWYSPYVTNLGDFGVLPEIITSLEKNITRGEMAEIIWRWDKEITNKSFVAYEDGELVSFGAGEVIFGIPVDNASECGDDELFDSEYSMCILKSEADAQMQIEKNIGSFDTVPKIPDHKDHADFEKTHEEGVLVHYTIANNVLVPHLQGSQVTHQSAVTNTRLHKHIWETFYTLIPQHSAKARITQFVLFETTPDTEGTLAYVHQSDENPAEWVLGVNYDENFDTNGVLKNPQDFYYTLIHEFTHVLSLNEDNTDGFLSDCATYEIETGCLKAESIMGSLVGQFWKQSPHWDGFDAEDKEAGYDRYDETPNRYVTDYAATNPGEDIAEVFTHFVLHEKPTGTEVKDQKIQMLYAYPEMVSLRNAIRAALVKVSESPALQSR